MANEFGIADAKTIAKRLEAEIKDSTENTEEKEDLVGMINMLINMPNLLKEKKTLESAISKNRGILTQLEEKVEKEELEADAMIGVLRKKVLSEETNLAETEQRCQAQLKQMANDHEKMLTEARKKAKDEIGAIRQSVQEERDASALVKTELDKMEAKLAAFKTTVANM